jgi:hypothetical protein
MNESFIINRWNKMIDTVGSQTILHSLVLMMLRD